MEERFETIYLTETTATPSYIAYPMFLIDVKISETDKLVYSLLLNKAQREFFYDSGNRRIFVYFTITELSKTVRKSEMTIKNSLRKLEQVGLIVRRHQGVGKPNRIYVKVPKNA
ncbi:MAG: hypothetical protein LUC92_05415 [Clostridiales bacterium]|nr:hypothetical protein [Clostridiales bacterium]